jgi:cytochrome bd-type quinol oxidase subunit 2
MFGWHVSIDRPSYKEECLGMWAMCLCCLLQLGSSREGLDSLIVDLIHATLKVGVESKTSLLTLTFLCYCHLYECYSYFLCGATAFFMASSHDTTLDMSNIGRQCRTLYKMYLVAKGLVWQVYLIQGHASISMLTHCVEVGYHSSGTLGNSCPNSPFYFSSPFFLVATLICWIPFSFAIAFSVLPRGPHWALWVDMFSPCSL